MRIPPRVRTLVGDILPPRPNRRSLSIEEVAERHQRELAASEDRAVKQMRAAWRIAERRTTRDLQRVIAKISAAQASGMPVSPSWLFQQDRYTQYLTTVRGEIRRFGGRVARTVESQQRRSGAMAVRHVGDLFRAADVRAGFVRVPVEAVENIVGVFQDGSPLRELFDAVGPAAAANAAQVFVEEVASGRNPREIAKRLVAEVGLERERAFAIARQESLRSYRTAQGANYRANADVLEGWESFCALDQRSCPICIAMHGQIFPVEKSFMGWHVACRCTGLPVVVDGARTVEDGDAWMRDQSEAEQIRILGPTRARRFRAGMPLADMVEPDMHPRWGEGRRLIPLKRLASTIANQTSGVPAQPKSILEAFSGLPAKGFVRRALERAARNIDEVMPGVADVMEGVRIPFTTKKRHDTIAGGFSRPTNQLQDASLMVVEIVGGKKASESELADTLTHEIAHMLDFAIGLREGLGKNPDVVKRMASEAHPSLEPFRKSLRQKREWLTLANMQNFGVHLRSHGSYLMRYRECYARCMQRLVATRCSDAEALATYKRLFHADEETIRRMGAPGVKIIWSDGSADEVEEHLVNGLKALGIKVKDR